MLSSDWYYVKEQYSRPYKLHKPTIRQHFKHDKDNSLLFKFVSLLGSWHSVWALKHSHHQALANNLNAVYCAIGVFRNDSGGLVVKQCYFASKKVEIIV